MLRFLAEQKRVYEDINGLYKMMSCNTFLQPRRSQRKDNWVMLNEIINNTGIKDLKYDTRTDLSRTHKRHLDYLKYTARENTQNSASTDPNNPIFSFTSTNITGNGDEHLHFTTIISQSWTASVHQNFGAWVTLFWTQVEPEPEQTRKKLE
jgi:hypothetical protein